MGILFDRSGRMIVATGVTGSIFLGFLDVVAVAAVAPFVQVLAGEPMNAGLLARASAILDAGDRNTLALRLGTVVFAGFVIKAALGAAFRWDSGPPAADGRDQGEAGVGRERVGVVGVQGEPGAGVPQVSLVAPPRANLPGGSAGAHPGTRRRPAPLPPEREGGGASDSASAQPRGPERIRRFTRPGSPGPDPGRSGWGWRRWRRWRRPGTPRTRRGPRRSRTGCHRPARCRCRQPRCTGSEPGRPARSAPGRCTGSGPEQPARSGPGPGSQPWGLDLLGLGLRSGGALLLGGASGGTAGVGGTQADAAHGPGALALGGQDVLGHADLLGLGGVRRVTGAAVGGPGGGGELQTAGEAVAGGGAPVPAGLALGDGVPLGLGRSVGRHGQGRGGGAADDEGGGAAADVTTDGGSSLHDAPRATCAPSIPGLLRAVVYPSMCVGIFSRCLPCRRLRCTAAPSMFGPCTMRRMTIVIASRRKSEPCDWAVWSK